MKQKRHLYRNRHLAIKGNPLFAQRICRALKSKESYTIKNNNRVMKEAY